MSVEIDPCGAPAGLMSASVVLRQRRRSVSSTGVKLSARFPPLSQRLDASTAARRASLTRLLQTHGCSSLSGGQGFDLGARPRPASRSPVVLLCQAFENNNNPHQGRPEESGALNYWCKITPIANFWPCGLALKLFHRCVGTNFIPNTCCIWHSVSRFFVTFDGNSINRPSCGVFVDSPQPCMPGLGPGNRSSWGQSVGINQAAVCSCAPLWCPKPLRSEETQGSRPSGPVLSTNW